MKLWDGILLTGLLLLPTTAAAQERPEHDDYGGLFSVAEAEALHERWDYVEGWFGGELTRYANLNIHKLFPLEPVRRSGPVTALVEAPRSDIANFMVNTTDRGQVTLDDYVSNDPRVDGFVVLHHGQIVYERYINMRQDDRHIYFSVSKMFVGLLISKLQDQGLLDVAETVDHYIPELAGTSWEGISIRNVLDMASGNGCYENNDAYADIESCFMVMESSLGLQPKLPIVSFRSHIATAPQGFEQGSRYDYTSANTNILMFLAEVVTGKEYPELLSEHVWMHLGAEHDGLIISGDYAAGQAAAGHAGIFTTLRDLGRAGLFMLGQSAFHQKLLDDARPELTGPSHFESAYGTAGDLPTHAAWQSDVVFADGDFGKSGYGGQFLHVSPRRDLVVAWFGSFGEDLVNPDLQSVARQLSTSSLFTSNR